MPIDASIPLQANLTGASPLDTAAKAMTLKHLMQQDQLAPLQMESAKLGMEGQKMEIAAAKKAAADAAATKAVFQDSFDPGTGQLDKKKALSKLYGVNPEMAVKLGTTWQKEDATFRQQMQQEHERFIKMAAPLASSVLSEYDKQVKSGVPQDVAWANLQPRVAASFEMLNQGGFGNEWHGGDPKKMTPEQLRGIANQSEETQRLAEQQRHNSVEEGLSARRAAASEKRASAAMDRADDKDMQLATDATGNVIRYDKHKGEAFKQGEDGSWEKLDKLPTGLQPIGKGAQGGAMNQRYAQRTITAGSEVTRGLEMLGQFPIGTAEPLFANVDAKGGISAALRKGLTNKLSDEQAMNLQSAMGALDLELTTLLRGGMNLNEAELTGVRESIAIRPGMTTGNALYRLANAAAKAKTALENTETYTDIQAKNKEAALKSLSKYPSPEKVYEAMYGKSTGTYGEKLGGMAADEQGGGDHPSDVKDLLDKYNKKP